MIEYSPKVLANEEKANSNNNNIGCNQYAVELITRFRPCAAGLLLTVLLSILLSY